MTSMTKRRIEILTLYCREQRVYPVYAVHAIYPVYAIHPVHAVHPVCERNMLLLKWAVIKDLFRASGHDPSRSWFP